MIGHIASAQLVNRRSYQLLLQRDLLELHLVDAGLGGAQKRRGGDQNALHDGQDEAIRARPSCVEQEKSGFG